MSTPFFPLYIHRIQYFVRASDEDHSVGKSKQIMEPVATSVAYDESFKLVLASFSDVDSQRYRQILDRQSNFKEDHWEFNLDEYVSGATLPSIAWEPRTKQAWGNVRLMFNSERALRAVYAIPENDFFRRETQYYEADAPSKDTQTFKRWSLRVPHPNFPYVPSAGVLEPDNETDVRSWVAQVAMQTALCILQSVDTELADLGFKGLKRTVTVSQQTLCELVFRRRRSVTHSGSEMLLGYYRFPECSKSHNCIARNTLEPMRADASPAQFAMSQMHDRCKEGNMHFWIITTYEYWIFGAFSRQYGSVAVTKPITYDHTKPTILQCIVYWLRSAALRPGAFEIPKVELPVRRPEVSPFIFGLPAVDTAPRTDGMWQRTVHLWREMCFGELEPELARLNWNSSDFGPALDMCKQSWKARNGEGNSFARYAGGARSGCARVLQAFSIKGPLSMAKCRVVLVWLALLLHPVTCNLKTPCLEKAFVTVSSNEKDHPIHQNLDHDQRKWAFNPENPNHFQPKILRLGTTFDEDKKDTDLFTFINRHASSEVSFILERCLPRESADTLRDRLIEADLLAVPIPAGPAFGNGAFGKVTRFGGNDELTNPSIAAMTRRLTSFLIACGGVYGGGSY